MNLKKIIIINLVEQNQNEDNEIDSFPNRKTEFKTSKDDPTPRCFKNRLKSNYQYFYTKVSNEGNNHTNKWREEKASVNQVFMKEIKSQERELSWRESQ